MYHGGQTTEAVMTDPLVRATLPQWRPSHRTEVQAEARASACFGCDNTASYRSTRTGHSQFSKVCSVIMHSENKQKI